MSNLSFQTFAQLILPNAGFDTNNDVKTVSNSEAFTESKEDKGISRYIQPSGAEHESLKDSKKDCKIEMYNVSGLVHRTDSRAPETAEAKAWDFNEINQFLSDTGKTGSTIEDEIVRVYGLWESKDYGYISKYPSDYKIDDLRQRVSTILDIKTIGRIS